jgi:hypothetical protein
MYNPTTYIEPFWAENSGFMVGRDPLGIQNSSITVYSKLLPGMTNLTQRLRYYGFYCWLLKGWDENPSNRNKIIEDQFNYIRRAELLLSFIMVNTSKDQLAVIGSDYANKNSNDILLNIKAGADKTKPYVKGSLYWDFTSGALGQYYAGSLNALELINTKEKFFVLNNFKGLKLAKAFESAINETVRNLFLESIENGTIVKNDLEKLKSFGLQNIEEKSEEWNCYKDFLIEPDNPLNLNSKQETLDNRRESIKLYLEYLKQQNNEHFSEFQFNLKKNGLNKSKANIGWYYYYLNESNHFAISSIFWVILSELEGRPILFTEFLNSIRDLALNYFNEKHSLSGRENITSVIQDIANENLPELLKEVETLTKSKTNTDLVIGKAFKLLFVTYKNAQENIEEIKEFENLNYINLQNGNVSEFITKYTENFLSCDLNSYVSEIIKLILNNHMSTAYRKMGNGESNLLKFTIEDNLIMHIQTMQPNHTNPRLNTLRNFLIDLKIIDIKTNLTPVGQEVLAELQN